MRAANRQNWNFGFFQKIRRAFDMFGVVVIEIRKRSAHYDGVGFKGFRRLRHFRKMNRQGLRIFHQTKNVFGDIVARHRRNFSFQPKLGFRRTVPFGFGERR
jgi:hypothetical protein